MASTSPAALVRGCRRRGSTRALGDARASPDGCPHRFATRRFVRPGSREGPPDGGRYLDSFRRVDSVQPERDDVRFGSWRRRRSDAEARATEVPEVSSRAISVGPRRPRCLRAVTEATARVVNAPFPVPPLRQAPRRTGSPRGTVTRVRVLDGRRRSSATVLLW